MIAPIRITRRAALAGTAALATPFIRPAAAADKYRIGLLLAKTGDIAAQTEYLAQGTYLALAQRNNQLMGRPAELVWYDEPTPQGAQQNMQKLVQEERSSPSSAARSAPTRSPRRRRHPASRSPAHQQRGGDGDHRTSATDTHSG